MSTEDHIPLYLITTPEESTLWWLSIVSDRCEHLVASATSWIDTLCLSPSSKQPTPKSRVDETARYGLRWSVLLFHLENILVSTESSHWRSLKFFEDSARMLSAKISAHPRLATMSETTSAASRAASWWKIRVPLDIEKSELACVGTNSLRLYFRLYQLFQLAAYAKRPTSAKNPTQIPVPKSLSCVFHQFPCFSMFFWYGSMALPLALYTGGRLFFSQPLQLYSDSARISAMKERKWVFEVLCLRSLLPAASFGGSGPSQTVEHLGFPPQNWSTITFSNGKWKVAWFIPIKIFPAIYLAGLLG